MTGSKLTWHFQGLGGEAQQIAAGSQARWIKVIDPPAENPFPGKQIIGRTYLDDGEANALVALGELGAEIWFARWRPIYESRDYVALWEGPNEPQPIHDATFRRNLVAFTLRWAERMHGIGKQVIGLCLSVGCPDIDQFGDFLPLIGHVDAFASHEYSAPTLQDGASWYCLRYRRFFEVIRQAGLTVPPWFITECGIDGGVLTPPRTRSGWQAFTTAADYIAQLAWYDGELRRDLEIQAATIFTARPNGDWVSFDVNAELSTRLAAYLATVPDAPTERVDGLTQALAVAFGAQFSDQVAALPRHTALRYAERPLADIQRMVLHHTATPKSTTWEAVARYHVATNGWPGIGYHIGIDDAGRVVMLNYPTTVAYHVGAANGSTLGIVLPGNYMTDTPSAAALATLKRVVTIVRAYLDRELPIVGHRDVTGDTACPGDHLEARLPALAPALADNLPENEPDGPASFLAEKVRWWQESATRALEAGDTTRALAILHSLVQVDRGLSYRLERALKKQLEALAHEAR